MIFVCSRGRRESLCRFFMISKPSLAGRVLIDDDDPTYEGMELPTGWKFVSGPRGPVTQILNRAFESMPKEPFYGVICDDMVYQTQGWDISLSEKCQPKFVAWGDDGRRGPTLCTSFFVGGDLVRHFGWLVHPKTGHLYGDTIWWAIARGADIARYDPSVQFRHHKIYDKTYLQRRIHGDAESFKSMIDAEIPDLALRAATL